MPKSAGWSWACRLIWTGRRAARSSHPAFIRNLAARDSFPDLPVLLWDERLSTAAVERTLIDADTSRAKRGAVIDKMAAAFILQGALTDCTPEPEQIHLPRPGSAYTIRF